mgnify:CR=1 FL=1
MRTSHRNYSDEVGDFKRLSQFMIENYAQIRKHSTWCLGRLVDWKYALWGDKQSNPEFWDENAHLWFDGFGGLAGFAISENGGPDIAIITSQGYRFLFEQILLWVLENWGAREPALSIEIKAIQEMETRILESNGFQCDSSFYTSHFDLSSELVQRYPLDERFAITAMKSESDYRSQLLLRQNAFGGKTEMSEDEIARISKISRHGRQNPIYHADTDLCVVSPDGIFVSGCEALIDAYNLEVDIERVCTHSDYRRRGFARAVIQECLHRLKDMGMKKAYITGYSEAAIALYNSIGAEKRTESLISKHKVKK